MPHIFPKTKLLNPPLLPEVRAALSQLEVSDFLNYSRVDIVKYKKFFHKVKSDLTSWLTPFIDLSEMNYIYPTHGISAGIESWLTFEHRDVYRLQGDYYWPSTLRPSISIIDDINSLNECSVLYISNPSARDGNFIETWDKILKCRFGVSLDLAYLGTTEVRKIEVGNNVERVFYSLSKPFGIPHLRVGWLFSRNPIPSLELFDNYCYAPITHYYITQKIVHTFEPGYVYKRLKTQQSKICKNLDVLPSDVVYLGHSQSESLSSFRRESHPLARLSLCDSLIF